LPVLVFCFSIGGSIVAQNITSQVDIGGGIYGKTGGQTGGETGGETGGKTVGGVISVEGALPLILIGGEISGESGGETVGGETGGETGGQTGGETFGETFGGEIPCDPGQTLGEGGECMGGGPTGQPTPTFPAPQFETNAVEDPPTINNEYNATNAVTFINTTIDPLNRVPVSSTGNRRRVSVPASTSGRATLVFTNISDPDNDPIKFTRRYNGNVFERSWDQGTLTLIFDYELNNNETAEIIMLAEDTYPGGESKSSATIEVIVLTGIGSTGSIGSAGLE